MLTHLCAFCGNHAHFTARYGYVVDKTPEGLHEIEVAATCDSCGRVNVAKGIAPKNSSAARRFDPIGNNLTMWAENMTEITWSPPSTIEPDTEYLPDVVGDLLLEAHRAYTVGAYRAVLLVVRSAIGVTAREHGIKSTTLTAQIDKLHEKGMIRPGTKDVAYALCALDIDLAGTGTVFTVTGEDAMDALSIVRFVLDDVYVADARRSDILKRRAREEK